MFESSSRESRCESVESNISPPRILSLSPTSALEPPSPLQSLERKRVSTQVSGSSAHQCQVEVELVKRLVLFSSSNFAVKGENQIEAREDMLDHERLVCHLEFKVIVSP